MLLQQTSTALSNCLSGSTKRAWLQSPTASGLDLANWLSIQRTRRNAFQRKQRGFSPQGGSTNQKQRRRREPCHRISPVRSFTQQGSFTPQGEILRVRPPSRVRPRFQFSGPRFSVWCHVVADFHSSIWKHRRLAQSAAHSDQSLDLHLVVAPAPQHKAGITAPRPRPHRHGCHVWTLSPYLLQQKTQTLSPWQSQLQTCRCGCCNLRPRSVSIAVTTRDPGPVTMAVAAMLSALNTQFSSSAAWSTQHCRTSPLGSGLADRVHTGRVKSHTCPSRNGHCVDVTETQRAGLATKVAVNCPHSPCEANMSSSSVIG